MERNCGSCKYAVVGVAVECRRRAPIHRMPSTLQSDLFPKVTESDWCGEYEVKELAAKATANFDSVMNVCSDAGSRLAEQTNAILSAKPKVTKPTPPKNVTRKYS
jgi:hypothetical protein